MWENRKLSTNDGLEGIDEAGPSTTSGNNSRNKIVNTLSVQFYLAVAATLVCVLQIWILSSSNFSVSTDTASNSFASRQYSKDFRYMSLDHQYDDLWQFGNHTYLRVPETELEAEGDIPVAISM